MASSSGKVIHSRYDAVMNEVQLEILYAFLILFDLYLLFCQLTRIVYEQLDKLGFVSRIVIGEKIKRLNRDLIENNLNTSLSLN